MKLSEGVEQAIHSVAMMAGPEPIARRVSNHSRLSGRWPDLRTATLNSMAWLTQAFSGGSEIQPDENGTIHVY